MRAILFTLIIWACAFVPAVALDVQPSRIDFSLQAAGQISTATLNLSNATLKPIRFQVRPACDCLTAEPDRGDVPAGATRGIALQFTAPASTGPYSSHLFVQSNDANTPYVKIPVIAQVYRGGAGALTVHLFGSRSCASCERLRSTLIPDTSRRLNVPVLIEFHDTAVPAEFERLLAYEQTLTHGSSRFPVLVIGQTLLAGMAEIEPGLEAAIAREAAHKTPSAVGLVNGSQRPDIPAVAAGTLRFLPILGAALADSVNPCALATIVFFLSYLGLVLKKPRREVLWAGLCFIAGVFAAYYAIGMGLWHILSAALRFDIFARALYAGMGVAAIAVGLRHAYEAWRIASPNAIGARRGMMLGLPDGLRMLSNRVITVFTASRFLPAALFVAGVVVTLIEFVCTGQVYLPAIMYLQTIEGYRAAAAGWLAIYCGVFVVPLIAALIIYDRGISTLDLKRRFSAGIPGAKKIAAAFFLGIGILLIRYAVR